MRHFEGSEGKVVLGRDTKISIGTAVAVMSSLTVSLIWGTVQVADIKSAIRRAVSIEEFQAWTEEFQHRNPTVNVPSPMGIRVRRAESNLLEQQPLALR